MYRKKYTVSVGKLMSKKVDSLLEKRMVEIAQKEDRKNQEWFRQVTTVDGGGGFDWPGHGPYLRVPSASCSVHNAGTLFNRCLTDVGQLIKNQIDSAIDATTLSNYIRIKNMSATFDFRYAGSVPCKIQLWIVGIPAATRLRTDGVTVPTIHTCPGYGLNILNKYRPRAEKETVEYKFRVVAKKLIHFKPTQIYTPAWPLNNNNATAWSNPVHMEQSKTVTISHTFKGAGKKFIVIDSDDSAQQMEYYLCMLGDAPVTYVLAYATRFRLDGALQRTALG